jgi:chromosomal replication initiator protein
MTFPPEVWDGVLRRLQKELAPVSFEMWIPQISVRLSASEKHAKSELSENLESDPTQESGDGGHKSGQRHDIESIELLCPTQFHCERVREYFFATICDCVAAELGYRVSIRVEVGVGVEDQGNVSPLKPAVRQVEPARAESSPASPALQSVPRAFPHAVPRATTLAPALLAPVPAGASYSARPACTAGMQVSASRTASQTAGSSNVRLSRPSNRRSMNTQSISQALSAAVPTATAAAPRQATSIEPTPAAVSAARPTQARSGSVVLAPPSEAHAKFKANLNNGTGIKSDSNRGGAFRQPTFPLTFDSFTVGTSNALAREAAMVFADQQPGRVEGQERLGLNHLFIVSESGLGKTHLSRAVIEMTAPSVGDRARYTTAESFTSEFTAAVRNNQMPDFKRRYRTRCDLLVFEDVQFLEGKAATQLEFFHTVQHVLDCGGRVLLTGDKFPQELTQLDERIRARIASGFVAEMEAPDATVRRNILRSKAAHGGIRLPDDCVDLLVNNIEGNVRELEGALIQLVTVASLYKRTIDLELTEQSLKGRTRRSTGLTVRTTPEDIINSVAVFFQTSASVLASRSRRRDVLIPRQLSMYLCRRYTDASLADIGRALNRDHPSVANAIKKVERQLLENVRLRYQAEAVIARLDELGHKPLHSAG